MILADLLCNLPLALYMGFGGNFNLSGHIPSIFHRERETHDKILTPLFLSISIIVEEVDCTRNILYS